MTEDNSFHLGYRRSLDGVRGISILLVVFAHIGFLGPRYAVLGVNTFFVLSGFLITCLLIEEWNKSQDISLKHFYVRRALRLLPALLAVLTVFVVYGFCFEPAGRAMRDFFNALRALFYVTNWAQVIWLGRPQIFGHTWSLSIEEQFYLIWPPVLLLLLRKASRTSILWWVLLAGLLSCFIRVALLMVGTPIQGHFWRLYCGLDTRADSLLSGCFAAVVLSSNLLPRKRWLNVILECCSLVGVIGMIWITTKLPMRDDRMCSVGWFAISWFAAAIIANLLANPGSILHGMLKLPPLVYVGKISYGLYLWHFPIMRVMESWGWVHWKFFFWPICAAVTLMSYYWLELPCLRLKKRFRKTERNVMTTPKHKNRPLPRGPVEA